MKQRVYLSLICAVALNLSAADLGEIQVESSTIEDLSYDKKTEVSTVNTIDAKTIEELNPKNINEVLQAIPGITADARSNVVEIHMRGIGQQEFMWEDTGVAIVVDGVPVLQDGGKVRLNMNEIESIKVIKGGASYLYGNTALAGAVIITTKKHKNKSGAELEVERGSYGYENFVGRAYQSTEQYSVNVMTSYEEEEGYWYNSKNYRKTASGLFTYYIDDTSDITLSLDYVDSFEQSGRGSVTGVTEADENPTGEGDYAWSADNYMEFQKHYITYSKDFENGGNLKANTYYYKDLTSNLSSPVDTNNLDGNASEDDYNAYARTTDEDIEQYGVKLEYKNNYKNLNLAYLFGFDAGSRQLESDTDTIETGSSTRSTYYAGESSYEDTSEERYAAYTELKYRINPDITTVANVRYDKDIYSTTDDSVDYNGSVWSRTIANDSTSFENVSYRLGSTYAIDKATTAYANISTGFRNPTAEQVYKGNYDEDYVNNPDLKQETTITYEIGLRGNVKYGISYEASVFITDTKDIIAKNAGTYYSYNTDLMYDNVGDARNQGLELSAKSDRSKEFSFSLAYTYLDAYYTKHNPFVVDYDPTRKNNGEDIAYDIEGNQLPRVPHHKLDLIGYYKILKNLELMGEIYAQSDYYADETNFVKMPGYGIFNAKATYQHKKDLELFFQVKNVFDKQYYRTVYLFSDRDGDGALTAEDASITVDPGRVMYAGLKYIF